MYRREKTPVSPSRKSDVIAYLSAWAVGIEEFRDQALAGGPTQNQLAARCQ